MFDSVVLDSSALMALLRSEEGADRVRAVIGRSVISSLNLAEVQTKLVGEGMDEEVAWLHIAAAECPTVNFNDEHARVTGALVRVTRPFGLSLGDRACLALAIDRKATVYTTDRIWKKLDLGIRIEAIR
jgi:PIN domain nuclease of toxin-antitoxin system